MAITKTQAVARIKARRAQLLGNAANTLALAETIRGYGDLDAAADLVTEARTFLAAAERLAPSA